MIKSRLLGAVCALMFAALATNSQASLVVPTGLSPGDAYHIIFVTSTESEAVSSDIATYDAFAQAAADAAGIGASIGVDWRTLGSTPSVNAIDHLAPLFTDLSAPIYNQNGDLIASSFADLWDGFITNNVIYDEYGNYHQTSVWTGTSGNGTAIPNYELGGTSGVLYGDTSYTNSYWLYYAAAAMKTDLNAIYAVSEQLVVSNVPIPGAIWLFGSGLIGLIGISRHGKT